MGKIIVLGLGAGELDQMSLGVYRMLLKSKHVFLRTGQHPVVTQLEAEGFQYTSFDNCYEMHDSFEKVYQEITTQLLEAAKENDIIYAVPGHPFVAESTVQLLLAQAKELCIAVEFAGGQSFLDAMFQALQIDPIDGCQIVDGTALKRTELQIRQHIIICQVYDAFIASEVKLTLMEKLPDDYEVTIVTAAGGNDEKLQTIPLYELDRVAELNNLTAVYVPPVEDERLLYQDFDKLREIISCLRGPNGCPWDKKQTHQSLKKYLLEEAYEVIAAIDEEDTDHLVEELGDILLQVLLHSQIGEDEGMFTIDDVVKSTSEKMIRRHPHVFNETNINDENEVIALWDTIKQQEKHEVNRGDSSVLAGIPLGLPALLRAFKLQKKAAKVGFDWDDVAPVWQKVQEELEEFSTETKENNMDKAEQEFGDVLFALVNLARFYKFDPELALQKTNEKFYSRFCYIEEALKEKNFMFSNVDLAYLDRLWEAAKKKEV